MSPQYLLDTNHCIVSLRTRSAGHAAVRSALRRAGQPLESFDVAIAAAVIAHGLTLVTHDQHFQRLARLVGLVLDDWFP